MTTPVTPLAPVLRAIDVTRTSLDMARFSDTELLAIPMMPRCYAPS